MPRILMLVAQPLDPDPRIDREARILGTHDFHVRVVGMAFPGHEGYREIVSPISDDITKQHLDARTRLFDLAWNGWTRAVLKQVKFNLECLKNHKRLLIGGVSAIHCNDADTLPIGWFLSRISGARLVYDAHEAYSGMFSESVPSIFFALVDAVERIFSRKADLVITTGDLMARRMRRISGKSPLKLRNAPFRSFAADVKRIERKDFVVGYVGAFREGRCLDELLTAFEQFHTDHPDSKLVIAGWGELADRIAETAKGSRGSIIYMGKIPEHRVPEVLAGLSLAIVFTSKSRLNHIYACSNKLWEAAATGVPVLVTDIGELSYIVRTYGLGFVVDSDNVEAIRNRLTEIYNRRDELFRIGSIAREVFRTSFCWDILERSFLDAYRKLLAS